MSAATRPVSIAARTSRAGRVGTFLFCGVFFAAGAAFGIPFFGVPLLHMVSARGWQSASCQIISSRVLTNRDSDGSTHRVDVTYRYAVDDRAYTGDRYQFMQMSSSGYQGKAATVARLAPGMRTACWVNPADPTDAVIERGPTADLWFGLIPLVFIVVGGAGMAAAAVGRRQFSGLTSTTPNDAGAAYTKAVRSTGSTTLRPRASRGAQLGAIIFIALLWNGILSLFLWDAGVHGVFRVVLLPFVLIGIGLVVLVIRQALVLSNPRPTITVNKAAVALGTELRIEWSFEGRVDRLTRCSLTLEGREEATYRRGTDTSTDTKVFATIPLVNQTAPSLTGRGSAKVTIPADTMHSFDAPHNKIVWVIRVLGEVPRWPDCLDDFPLTVTPRER